MRPPLPVATRSPPMVTTHPSNATAAPTHFMTSGPGNSGVSPSRCLIFTNPIAETIRTPAPTSKMILPGAPANQARPPQRRTLPARNHAKYVPCDLLAAIDAPPRHDSSSTPKGVASGRKIAVDPVARRQRQEEHQFQSGHHFEHGRQLALEPQDEHQRHQGEPLPPRVAQALEPSRETEQAQRRPRSFRGRRRRCSQYHRRGPWSTMPAAEHKFVGKR